MIFGLEKQSRRRVAVVLIYAIGLAQLAYLRGLALDWFPRGTALLGAIAMGATFVGAFTLLNHVTRSYGVEKPSAGDERQHRVRDAAYRRAYVIFTVSIMLFDLYVDATFSKKMAGKLWMPTVSSDEWRLVSWAIVFAAVTLPQAIIAWQEPDPPAEEEAAALQYAAR